eukprot:350847-Chlamydomonas_euryale.AAC.8
MPPLSAHSCPSTREAGLRHMKRSFIQVWCLHTATQPPSLLNRLPAQPPHCLTTFLLNPPPPFTTSERKLLLFLIFFVPIFLMSIFLVPLSVISILLMRLFLVISLPPTSAA